MLKPLEKTDTKTRILEAANAISLKLGPAHLSLEVVAAEAGISKGGLLYHFPSKQALLRALVARYVDAMRADMEAMAPGWRLPNGPALTAAVAYLEIGGQFICQSEEPMAGVLAAMAEDPGFIAPMLAFRNEVSALFRRCPRPAQAHMVFLASQGIVHICMTDPGSHGGQDVARLFGDLKALLLEGQATPADAQAVA